MLTKELIESLSSIEKNLWFSVDEVIHMNKKDDKSYFILYYSESKKEYIIHTFIKGGTFESGYYFESLENAKKTYKLILSKYGIL